MHYQIFAPQERDILISILLKDGRGLRNSVRKMIKEGHDDWFLLDIMMRSLSLWKFNQEQVLTILISLNELQIHEFISRLRNGAASTNITSKRMPKDVSNKYRWFVDNNADQITQYLKYLGSIPDLVREFNATYAPQNQPTCGLKTIRALIKNRNLNPYPKNCWLEEHPEFRQKIIEEIPTPNLYAMAKNEGYRWHLRTFQRMVKQVKMHSSSAVTEYTDITPSPAQIG